MSSSFTGPLFISGVPTFGGIGIPATFGRVYFVDADNGDDGRYRGKSVRRAFKTVQKALDTVRSNEHDVIVLSGVGAHVIADELTITKNRIHLVGLGGGSRYYGQRTRFEMGVTTGTAIAIVKNTGVGNTFTNIKFRSVDTLAASLYSFADGGEFTQCTNCSFEKATDLDQTTAAEFLANGDSCYYKNCSFGNYIYEVSVARAVILFTRETITGKVARDTMFEDCLFLNKTSDANAIMGKATTNDIERLCLYKNCFFGSAKTGSATMALVFAIASALTDGEITLQDCVVQNITNVAANTAGIFTNSPTPVANATETVAVHTS